MIRRFYILPLKHGVGEERVAAFVQTLSAADQYIPGLLNSSAGLDADRRTVLWENVFVDEETYTGPYMVHPYHIGAIDSFVMPDSPECVTQDTYTMRYEMPGSIPRLDQGLRRVVFLNLPEGADTSVIEALADRPEGMAASVLCTDNVGWRSAKGLAWTHIWEQEFADSETLETYLRTRDGISCSSKEGFRRLGADVESLTVFCCPFALNAVQSPPAMPEDSTPAFYTITARLAAGDADAYVELLESCYDPAIADSGGTLVQRRRSAECSLEEVEVQSAWRLDTLAAYSDMRITTYGDPRWQRFVAEAMPLLKQGTRRFYRDV